MRCHPVIEVYRLDIELGAPVAASDPFIHLDSFLSYAAGIEELGFDGLQELDEGDEPEYFEEEMPLEKVEVAGEWVWACSSALIAPLGEEVSGLDSNGWNVTRWRKRFDPDLENSVKNTQINITTGHFKSYNAALPYNAVDTLVFYFCGDPDRVKELVERYIPALGKMRKQGFGVIRSVSVEEEIQADSPIFHDNQVLRSLPAQFLQGTPTEVTIERRTVRPPYWHTGNQTLAVAPFEQISEANIRDEAKNLDG